HLHPPRCDQHHGILDRRQWARRRPPCDHACDLDVTPGRVASMSEPVLPGGGPKNRTGIYGPQTIRRLFYYGDPVIRSASTSRERPGAITGSPRTEHGPTSTT